ncbi:MAG: 30S ribosomal protein S6e [Candidatus Methanomethylicia archaeon]|nr:30S ribosomal protein S6e [Candidatus Methanomethylicia archaeon]MCX8169064.1 30S ribosomal protein S6e [Candidatus Methanomethylicia archaeon]MDW7988796.1 30S ribosomal protein S6e [Nitrososphaerota archaeon]
MVKFKVVVSDPKTGKAKTFEVDEPTSLSLIGLKIGDIVDGSVVNLPNTKLKITGGSDFAGFPMIPYLSGGRRYRILLSHPPGFKPKENGLRKRKMVRGNTITSDIVQINTIIVEGGLPDK